MHSTYITFASTERQHWLCAATEAICQRYEGLGIKAPQSIRISIGIPKRKPGAVCDPIGQCWKRCMSSDGHSEIFISPELTDEGKICGVIAHELAHAIDDCEHGHRKEFKALAVKIGLTGKMTATEETPEFLEFVQNAIVAKIGKYPAGALINPPSGTHKRASSPRAKTVKFVCSDCDYECRVPEVCVQENGEPVCPGCHEPMTQIQGRRRTPSSGNCTAPLGMPDGWKVIASAGAANPITYVKEGCAFRVVKGRSWVIVGPDGECLRGKKDMLRKFKSAASAARAAEKENQT